MKIRDNLTIVNSKVLNIGESLEVYRKRIKEESPYYCRISKCPKLGMGSIEVLIEVQNGNLSYKDAIDLLNDLGLSVSDGTIGRALKRLEQQQ
jgi:hypothetical protein